MVLKDLGRVAEAEPLYREAIAGLERCAEIEKVASMRMNFAVLLRETGRLAEAAQALSALEPELSALEAGERLRGGDVFLPALCRQQLGSALLALGKHAEALPYLQRALEFQLRWIGPEHEQTLATRNELAIAAKAAQRFDLARQSYEELLPILKKQLGPQAKGTLAVQNNLAVVLQQMGEVDAAIALYAEILPAMRTALSAPHATLSSVLSGYAEALVQRERTSEAIELYRESIDGFRRTVGPDHAWTQQRVKALEQLQTSTGKRSSR